MKIQFINGQMSLLFTLTTFFFPCATQRIVDLRGERLPTTVVTHLNGVVDDNGHTIDKLLFNLNDVGGTITINSIALYDGTGSTCNDYTNEAWSGSITHSGLHYTTINLHLTYDYPGGGTGSVTINRDLSDGGIICD
jgi:hypothetical protein